MNICRFAVLWAESSGPALCICCFHHCCRSASKGVLSDNTLSWRCSIGIAEQSTFRATKGLLTSGLTNPSSVKEADRREQIDAVNSQGNVQRGKSCEEWFQQLHGMAVLLVDCRYGC